MRWKNSAEGSLKYLERNSGADSKCTLDCIHNLAVTLSDAGQLEQPYPIQLKTVERAVLAYGKDSEDAASAYSAIGSLLKLKGNIVDSKEYFNKALSIRKRKLGNKHHLTQLIRLHLEELDSLI